MTHHFSLLKIKLIVIGCSFYLYFREILLEDVNNQRKQLKEEGISVDGKHFSPEFVGNIHMVYIDH